MLHLIARSGILMTLLLTAPAFAQDPACDGIAAAELVDGLGGADGFGADVVAPGDDHDRPDPSPEVDLTGAFPDGLNFFGAVHDTVFVNINGNLSFSSAVEGYTPESFPISDQPLIAPFWADVDTRPRTQPPPTT